MEYIPNATALAAVPFRHWFAQFIGEVVFNMRRILAGLLAVVLVFATVGCQNNKEVSAVARIISVFEIEGDSVRIIRENGQEFEAKKGIKLFEGYRLLTGDGSITYLELDGESYVKVAENSEIEITRLNDKNLQLTVISGAVSVDAAAQKPGSTLEVGAGNTSLAVRGTLFVVETAGGDATYSMLHGLGEIEGTSLATGHVLPVPEEITLPPEPEALSLTGNVSIFVLEVILEHKDMLLAEGVFSQQELDSIPALIEAKKDALHPKELPSSNPAPGSANSKPPVSQPLPVSRPSFSSAANNNPDVPTPAPSSASGQAVATIGNKNYDSVASAITAAENGQTVKIEKNTIILASETARLQAGALLSVPPSVVLEVQGTFIVDSGATIDAQDFSTIFFTEQGILKNSGTMNIQGSLSNETSGQMMNENNSVINVLPGGVFENKSSAGIAFTNNGRIHVYNGGSFINNGILLSSGSVTAAGPEAAIRFTSVSRSSGAGLENKFFDGSGEPIAPKNLNNRLFYYDGTRLMQAAVKAQQNGKTQYYSSLNGPGGALAAGGNITVFSSATLTDNLPAGARMWVLAGVTLRVPGSAAISCAESSKLVLEGSLVVDGRYTTAGETVIEQQGSLNIQPGASFTNSGALTNLGTINNFNSDGAGFFNRGSFTNNGVVN